MADQFPDAQTLETSLRLDRDRAQAIISSMGEGLMAIDTDYKVILINPAAQSLLEVNADQAIGRNWSELVTAFHGENPVEVQNRPFAKAITEQKTTVTSLDDNHYYQSSTGRKFPITSITNPLYSGNQVVGAIKVFRDATLEKEQRTIIERTVNERTQQLQEKNLALEKAQQEITQGWLRLQEEKARLAASINSVFLGFLLIDVTENILVMNPASLRMFNLSAPLKQFREVVAIFKDFYDLSKLHVDCRYEKRDVEVNDVTFQDKILRILVSPILSTAQGFEECIGSVVLFDDVTEAKVMARSKDEFFSIASHELRTPLTAIRGNVSMIKQFYSEKLSDPTFKEMVDDIYESSIRLIGIVNDFLDLSRLEQGKIKFKQAAFDPVELAQEAIKEYQSTGSQKNLYLKVNSPESALQVFADQNRTRQVLINLVGNALKFTDQGGITISFSNQDGFIEISVTDTGRGLSPSQQQLLFKKFQQAGESLFTRDTTRGTGLGLYISKLLIEGMGGKIWLQKSQPGVGTTFSFTLPKKS